MSEAVSMNTGEPSKILFFIVISNVRWSFRWLDSDMRLARSSSSLAASREK